MERTVDADVCIVGAGIAGLFAAWSLPPNLTVAIVDKGTMGEGSSPLAQGGLAAAVGPEDSPELHLADTLAAGAGLCDLRACDAMCEEAPARVRELIDLGCEFDRESGALHLAREGGQSVPRSVHRADATGAEIVRALRLAVGPRVRRVEAYAFELAVIGGACRGVWAIAADNTLLVRARAILLAAGGAGALFRSTTNPPAATGDAVALGWWAGARLSDLEFVQFHPTALAVAGSPRPLLTEALRGAGARLVDGRGRRFMQALHPDAELAPRHIVARAILDVGTAYLDATDLGAVRLEAEFPTAVAAARRHGLDLVTEPVPVAPAAHYLIGGVSTDLQGRSSLPGLFAAGECAATGVHGANRMAGNSLSEAVVFGRRAALAMAHLAESGAGTGAEGADPEWEPPPKVPSGASVSDSREAIVDAVTAGAGPIRDAATAHKALDRLDRLGEELREGSGSRGAEERAMLATGRLLVRAALAREETRGVHARSDHPDADPNLEGVRLEWAAQPG